MKQKIIAKASNQINSQQLFDRINNTDTPSEILWIVDKVTTRSRQEDTSKYEQQLLDLYLESSKNFDTRWKKTVLFTLLTPFSSSTSSPTKQFKDLGSKELANFIPFLKTFKYDRNLLISNISISFGDLIVNYDKASARFDSTREIESLITIGKYKLIFSLVPDITERELHRYVGRGHTLHEAKKITKENN
jgi:hypothetical protein